MQQSKIKTLIAIMCILSITLFSGCTNWKKKYQALNVEHQNLKGLFEREQSVKGQLADRVSQGQQTIDELQRRIAEQENAGEVTGFGEGYDVKVDAEAGTVTVTLPNTILFSAGKAVLKKATIGELDHIQSVLQQQYAGRFIDIVGHTDSDPIKKSKWKDNWELSAQRALTVTRYLIKNGISEDRILAVGCCPSRAVTSNASTSGKAKNRRVEIVVNMR